MSTLRTLLSGTLLACTHGLLAQAPQAFTYQAVARDLDGDALSDLVIAVRFNMHQGTAAGPIVFAEQQGAMTNDHGSFSLQVGNGAPLIGTFGGIDWRGGPYFLEVLLDDSLNGAFTSMGTQQLLSVPYALHAGSSSDVPDGTEVGQIMHWTGTQWVADSGLYVHEKRFGIGITQPEAPLSIKSRNALYEKFQNGDIPNQDDFAFTTGGNTGFGIVEDTTGGMASRLHIQSGTGHVGIGDDDPPAALSIESRETLKTYFETGDVPTQQQFYGISTDTTGFDIGQGPPTALQSRLFIKASTGNVGLGTTEPLQRLHLESSSASGMTGIKFLNTANSTNQGWAIGDVHDNTVAERMKTFALHEKKGADLVERITVLSSGNVGINEEIPDTRLHVSRPLTDPLSSIALAENTGILCLGQIEDNLAADHRGIQARHGEYIGGGTTLSMSASTLNLQRLGGDILIHGDATSSSDKGILTSDGRLGLGTIAPTEKLHIEEPTTTGITGIKMLNTATANGQGWKLGHLQDAVTERDGAFSILEEGSTAMERITVLPGGNVGINEGAPDTKLHVSRPIADPNSAISLIEGTGIAVIGPLTDNVVYDYRGLQARHGEYIGGGPTLSMSASTLNLQRLGGDILIHGDGAVADRGIITSNGKLGLGTITPVEKIEINGAIRIGTTITENEGTIRYTGTDFQGRTASGWTSLGGTWEKVDNTDAIYYTLGTAPRVGIGTGTVTATLSVLDDEVSTSGNVAAKILNQSQTSSSGIDDHRIGLQLSNSGAWGGSASSKDIGLYVTGVSGQSNSSANLAAVLNGNVVIGDISSQSAIGTGGTNVLAIQAGSPPAAMSGAPGVSQPVQLYVTTDVSGNSLLHVRTGDGNVIKLYRLTELTAADAATVDATYDGTEAALLNNMRTRINELETVLKTLGILPP